MGASGRSAVESGEEVHARSFGIEMVKSKRLLREVLPEGIGRLPIYPHSNPQPSWEQCKDGTEIRWKSCHRDWSKLWVSLAWCVATHSYIAAV